MERSSDVKDIKGTRGSGCSEYILSISDPESSEKRNREPITMKLDFAILTFALASVPAANAWRVRFYQLENAEGPQYTNAGPGGTGWRCHPNVGSLDGKVSSMRYWSDNTEHTTRCCIYLYTGQNCQGSLDRTLGHFCRNQYLNFHEWGLANKIRSYKTNCYPINPANAKRSIDGDESEFDPEFDPEFDQESEYDDGYEIEPEETSS